MTIHRQFLKFAIAGAVGFVVDAGALYVALACGLGVYAGRVVSFLCAAFVTWRINRRTTFVPQSGKSAWREWCEYLIAMSGGAVFNYAAYLLALRLLPAMALAPMLAVAAGSVAGMFVNFATAKLWVYRESKEARDSRRGSR